MPLSNLWEFLRKYIFSQTSFGLATAPLFNPYQEIDPTLDKPGADLIRQNNLFNYIQSYPKKPAILLVGEAPGWRGCRFSGVPFTSETQLVNNSLPFSGNTSSQGELPYSEASATSFWKVIKPFHTEIISWNCIPYHPHKPGNSFSNRTPGRHEILEYLHMLREIIIILEPIQIVAVGRKAKVALEQLDISFSTVRHPSHGGQKDFITGIQNILYNSNINPLATY